MKSKLSIVKIGGKVIEDAAQLDRLLQDFAAIKGAKMLIHGGGVKATELSKQLKIDTQLIEGRRITSLENLEVVTMVYAGLINKNISATLQKYGCNAIGLAGSDGNAFTSEKRKVATIDYGYVGDITAVNSTFIQLLLDNQLTPVFSAIGHDGKGQLLNTNADTVAAEIAIAMSALFEVELIYCFEIQGVLTNMDNEGSVITLLDEANFQLLKAEGIIVAGMLPKLNNCFHAINHGVSKVKIGNQELLHNSDCLHTKIINP